MKHLIVTTFENSDINQLLKEISKIQGVKNVEEERSFALEGNLLNEIDYLNIVKEADLDEFNTAEEVHVRLKNKFSK